MAGRKQGVTFKDNPHVPEDGRPSSEEGAKQDSRKREDPKKQAQSLSRRSSFSSTSSVSSLDSQSIYFRKPRKINFKKEAKSDGPKEAETFEGCFRILIRRLNKCQKLKQTDIKSLDDVDFVFVVNRPIDSAQSKPSLSCGTSCYEYARENVEQVRKEYLEALKSMYKISYKRIEGKTCDFYLIHLSYYHLGLLAELLRYQWQVKTSDAKKKVAYRTLSFYKWANSAENEDFQDCNKREDFHDRLRFDLAYQFLRGAVVTLASPSRQGKPGCGCCPTKSSSTVQYDLLRLMGDKIFDNWLIPHDALSYKPIKSKLASCAPCCIPCIEGCRSATGEEGLTTEPYHSERETIRDFLWRYCTLKTALSKHTYPRVTREKVAKADLWHIIPVHQVRDYAGEKIAFYFAWAELLTMTMLIPAVIGAGLFIALVIYYAVDIYYNQSANDAGINQNSPIGDFIQYVLAKSCDNYATPGFAILMVLWGTAFNEVWYRREAWYRFLWNVETLDVDELEHVRGQRSSTEEEDNPPLRKPTSVRVFFFFISAIVTLCFIALIFISIYAINVINYFSYDYCPTGSGSGSSSSSTSNGGYSTTTASYLKGDRVLNAVTLLPPNKTYNNLFLATTRVQNAVTTGRPAFYATTVAPNRYNPNQQQYSQNSQMSSYSSSQYSSSADIVTILICNLFSIAQVLTNSISIFILNLLYTNVAYKLTDWEGHPTTSRYSNALVLKLFIFRFFNFYTILFFTAFASNQISLSDLSSLIPGSKTVSSGSSSTANGCGDQPCLLKLTKQLLGILITQPVLNTVAGLVMPSVNALIQTIRRKTLNKIGVNKNEDDEDEEAQVGSSADEVLAAELEKQSKLLHLSNLGQEQFPADEFTEKLITFGALVMFSVALPPGPAMTLLFMRPDLTLDIRRMVTLYKRPIPNRANGIGLWNNMIALLTYLAIITNPLIVILDSSWGSQFSTYWKFWIFILFEHFVFATRALIAAVIPDVPVALEREKLRRKIVLHELMEENASKK